jgi:hypothetical protein
MVGLLFGAWLCMLLVLTRDMDAGSDADHRFQSLRHWIEDGIAPTEKWPMIGTILGAPMYFLGRLYQTPEWWMYRYPAMLCGVALVVLDRLLEPHLATAPRRRFLLLLLVASMVPYQLRSLSAESFNLSLLAVGFVALLQERWVLGTFAAALGGANIPATLGGVGLALLVSSVMLRKWRVLLPVVLGVLLTLTENWLKHGAPFRTPYLEDAEHGYRTVLPYSGLPGFSYPWLFGAISLLFSFGKGIFFFAPGMFLPLRRAAEELPVLLIRLRWVWVAHVIGLLVVYSKWWAWYGGFTWGPRFLVFASVPASLVLALKVERPSEKLLENLVVFLALALSAWVGMCATVFGLFEQGFCAENQYALEAFCWYLPEYSVLSRGIVMKYTVPIEHWILVVVSALTFLVTATPLLPVMARQLKALVVSALQSARAQPFRF